MFTSISKLVSLFKKTTIKSETTQKMILGFTVKASIIVQLITGIVTLWAVFFKLAPKDMILHDIVLMETIVQFIELAFYIFISYYLVKISVSDVTPLRYFDWIFTTPTMLLSTIMFFDYKNNQVKNRENDKSDEKEHMSTLNKSEQLKENKPVRFFEFLKKHKNTTILIFIYNFMMLMFGYLGEVGKINLYFANIIGFVFFGLTFYTMWDKYVKESKVVINHQIFYFMLIVWGLYGIFALMSPLIKNIGYNFLDIIAKNFYGVFIFYQIYLTRIQ